MSKGLVVCPCCGSNVYHPLGIGTSVKVLGRTGYIVSEDIIDMSYLIICPGGFVYPPKLIRCRWDIVELMREISSLDVDDIRPK